MLLEVGPLGLGEAEEEAFDTFLALLGQAHGGIMRNLKRDFTFIEGSFEHKC